MDCLDSSDTRQLCMVFNQTVSEFADYLVDVDFDSISLNPDSVIKTTQSTYTDEQRKQE
ncbi:MAG: hypothetical protein K0U68_08990 [Gammaproteobacteria bacterium]|nr:hypothetical protein [Gammaproteobacteria bacterium]